MTAAAVHHAPPAHLPVDMATMQSVLRAIETKDASTAAHTWRVTLYARALAEEAGLGHALVERISAAAALHDVGKLDIPERILAKPGPLTPQERREIEKHPIYGHDRLRMMGVHDQIALDLVRFHHERADGKGYPYGIDHRVIPISALHFAVIDTFDALTSVRPYRQEIGEEAAEHALTELRAGIGTRYCPDSVGMFEKLYRTGQLDWILHYFNDQCPVPDFSATPGLSARGRASTLGTVAMATP